MQWPGWTGNDRSFGFKPYQHKDIVNVMTTLFIILVVLFAVLFVLVPMLEKHASKGDGIDERRISRWIIPLMATVMILAILRHYFA